MSVIAPKMWKHLAKRASEDAGAGVVEDAADADAEDRMVALSTVDNNTGGNSMADNKADNNMADSKEDGSSMAKMADGVEGAAEAAVEGLPCLLQMSCLHRVE